MKSIAIIPLRAGSKGIPGKNKKRVLGRPLFQWCLAEAIFSDLDEVYVYTDDKEIIDFINKEYTWTNKVKGLNRPDETASDTASTESAMLAFANSIHYKFDILVLLQATSPLTDRNSINKSLRTIKKGQADSTLSVVKTKRFIWNNNGTPINYDYLNRPRRQDFNGLNIENGAIYACNKEVFEENKNRIGGKIHLVEMPEETLVEIDEPHDFLMIESLLSNELTKLKGIPSRIKLLVMDVDGVLADGTVLTGTEAELGKFFSLRDGMGISFLKENHIIPLIMTSEKSEIVHQRMKKLNIQHYYPGVRDKYAFLTSLLLNFNIKRNEVAYIGDDINDLANMLSVGHSFCPNNAVPTIYNIADTILNNKGGDMAVREAIEIIIKNNKRFN